LRMLAEVGQRSRRIPSPRCIRRSASWSMRTTSG
jgi:hypothetical protein